MLPLDAGRKGWRFWPAPWQSPLVSPTAGRLSTCLDSNSPYCSTPFMTGRALSAGQIAGGPSSGWSGNSTERPSMSRPLSGAMPQQRKPCTGKSSARIGSGGWASALCAGAGPIWKTPADLNVGCSQPGCALGSEASSQIGTLKAMICQQAWEWSVPAHGRAYQQTLMRCSTYLWPAS